MLKDLLSPNRLIEIERAELDDPVTLSVAGEFITVRNLIFASTAALAVADKALLGENSPHAVARPVMSLCDDDLRRLAIEMLGRSSPDEKIVGIGIGVFNPTEIVEEVKRGSSMGAKMVESIMLGSIYMEGVIASGNIRLVETRTPLRLPDFSF